MPNIGSGHSNNCRPTMTAQEEWYKGYVPDDDICALIANLRKKYSIIALPSPISSAS
jgi:hypothetical protein